MAQYLAEKLKVARYAYMTMSKSMARRITTSAGFHSSRAIADCECDQTAKRLGTSLENCILKIDVERVLQLSFLLRAHLYTSV